MADYRIAGLGADAVEYLAAWDLQREVHAAVVAGDSDDTVLLLEHPPVFTCGKRTDPHERPLDPGGAPVIDVDRGGKITFHGPGQLVGYPIVTLPDHVKVVDYVRRVEEALIHTCADLGVTTARVPGRSGVWLRADDRRGPERKVAAHRHPGQPRRHDARLRPQLRRRPRAGTTGSSPAASPTPASPRSAASSAATSPSPRCIPIVRAAPVGVPRLGSRTPPPRTTNPGPSPAACRASNWSTP